MSDKARKAKYERNCKTIMKRGQYKGKPMSEIPSIYLFHLSKHCKGFYKWYLIRFMKMRKDFGSAAATRPAYAPPASLAPQKSRRKNNIMSFVTDKIKRAIVPTFLPLFPELKQQVKIEPIPKQLTMSNTMTISDIKKELVGSDMTFAEFCEDYEITPVPDLVEELLPPMFPERPQDFMTDNQPRFKSFW